MRTEDEQHAAFERLCGCPERAFHLLQLWSDTYDHRTELDRLRDAQTKQTRKEQNFRKRAIREGYTDQQIKAFLTLQ